MIQRLDEPAAAEGPSIESWLGVLSRLLRLPEARAQPILDELESHLRDRIRDLMLGGADEADAMRQAIAELGSAAELARQLRNAHRSPARRLIMHLALFGTGAVSVVAAALIVSPASFPGAAYYEPSTAAVADERDVLDERAVTVDFDQTPLADVLARFGEELECDLVVHWPSLEAWGVSAGLPITLKLERPRAVSSVLELVAEQAMADSSPDPVLGWRYRENLLEFATPRHFDRREVVLGSFRLDGVLSAARTGADTGSGADRIGTLIHEYVEPEAWAANGGDVAQLEIVGTTMFVKAPARLHRQIEWILCQLGEMADSRPATAR